MEKLFLPCTCYKCDKTEEMELVISGPHVKGQCSNCTFYQKFVPLNVIPSVEEIKMKIWGMVGGDVGIINLAKKDISFIDVNLSNIQLRLMYWKLYLQIRKFLTHAAL